jgi:hypothetical protein
VRGTIRRVARLNGSQAVVATSSRRFRASIVIATKKSRDVEGRFEVTLPSSDRS